MLRSKPSAPETARLASLRPAAVWLLVGLGLAALWYLPARIGLFNPAAPVLSGLVLAAELIAASVLFWHVFLGVRVTQRSPGAPAEGAEADILILADGESTALVRRALVAAFKVNRRREVVLIDRAGRAERAMLAADLGARYLAPVNAAEALNQALAETSADFLAVFSADQAARRECLDQTLGYFQDRTVAFVQGEAEAYNLDSFEHGLGAGGKRAVHAGLLEARVRLPGLDRWNAAPLRESCAVLRRVALKRASGFVSEAEGGAWRTGLRLHKLGFGSVYHQPALAVGRGPDTFAVFAEARVRELRGVLHTWASEKILFADGLRFAQKLCYARPLAIMAQAWAWGVLFAAACYALAAGAAPVAGLGWGFALHAAPWFALAVLAHVELGRGQARDGAHAAHGFLSAVMTMLAATPLKLAPGKQLYAFFALAPLVSVAVLMAGLARLTTPAHPPLLINLALFAAVALMGAWSVIGFRYAARSFANRRAAYRIAAPVQFNVHLPSGGWAGMRAIDISADDVRLAAPLGLDFSAGKRVEAVLRLPAGEVALTLRVRRRAVVDAPPLPPRMELGCEIIWREEGDRDALTALLFETGLEARLLNLEQDGATPLSLLFDGKARRAAPMMAAATVWAAGAVEGGDGASLEVSAQPISGAFERWRVFSYAPLPETGVLRMPSPIGGAAAAVRIFADAAQAVGPEGARVYLTDVRIDARPVSPDMARAAQAQPAHNAAAMALAAALAAASIEGANDGEAVEARKSA